jgi:hypothetical protein
MHLTHLHILNSPLTHLHNYLRTTFHPSPLISHVSYLTSHISYPHIRTSAHSHHIRTSAQLSPHNLSPFASHISRLISHVSYLISTHLHIRTTISAQPFTLRLSYLTSHISRLISHIHTSAHLHIRTKFLTLKFYMIAPIKLSSQPLVIRHLNVIENDLLLRNKS